MTEENLCSGCVCATCGSVSTTCTRTHFVALLKLGDERDVSTSFLSLNNSLRFQFGASFNDDMKCLVVLSTLRKNEHFSHHRLCGGGLRDRSGGLVCRSVEECEKEQQDIEASTITPWPSGKTDRFT